MADTSPARDRSPAKTALALLGTALLAGSVAAAVLLRPAAPVSLPAPGLDAPVDAAELRGRGYDVVLAVLGTIYEAFALTEEGAIYDGLAEVAAEGALEALYLERAGALATGGLPDQIVHELRLTEGAWRVEDGTLLADIRWGILGEVGHAEHTHMRGNAYGAELVLAPAGGAWRLTEFVLTDVDRTEAGTLTTPPGAGSAAVGAPALDGPVPGAPAADG